MRKRSIGLVLFLVFGALTVATGQNMPTYTPYPGFPLQDVERALFAYQADFGAWPTDISDLELYAEATGQALDLERFAVLTLEPKGIETVRITYTEKGSDTEPSEYAVTLVTVHEESARVSSGKTAELEAIDTKTLVRRIQQALTDQGYNPGPVDGIPGEKTHQAIRRFQQDRGSPVDGEATAPLLVMLEDSGARSGAEASPEGLPQDRALVRKVQRELALRGYDPGPPDGILGQQTRRAMRQFLEDRQSALQAAQAGTPQSCAHSRPSVMVSPEWVSVREQIGPKLWPNHIPRP